MAEIRARLDGARVERAYLRGLEEDPRVGVQALVRRIRRRLDAEHREEMRLRGILAFEEVLWGHGVMRVAGVDEVGAGPLAGPVMAAAVILPPGLCLEGVDDSKHLSARARQTLSLRIRAEAVAYGFGSCSPGEIDSLNILRASVEAMRRAVIALDPPAEYLLVDARHVPRIVQGQTAIIGGDGLSHSIAAASIIAKVERDALMARMADAYPGYGFERHRGYGTAYHLEALSRLGPTPIHRRSFSPVR